MTHQSPSIIISACSHWFALLEMTALSTIEYLVIAWTSHILIEPEIKYLALIKQKEICNITIIINVTILFLSTCQWNWDQWYMV